eukprot:gene5214-biopygen16195
MPQMDPREFRNYRSKDHPRPPAADGHLGVKTPPLFQGGAVKSCPRLGDVDTTGTDLAGPWPAQLLGQTGLGRFLAKTWRHAGQDFRCPPPCLKSCRHPNMGGSVFTTNRSTSEPLPSLPASSARPPPPRLARGAVGAVLEPWNVGAAGPRPEGAAPGSPGARLRWQRSFEGWTDGGLDAARRRSEKIGSRSSHQRDAGTVPIPVLHTARL